MRRRFDEGNGWKEDSRKPVDKLAGMESLTGEDRSERNRFKQQQLLDSWCMRAIFLFFFLPLVASSISRKKTSFPFIPMHHPYEIREEREYK